LFINQGDKFVNETAKYGLDKTNGWYHSIAIGDFNEDGTRIFIAGNHGTNSRFKATISEPINLYVNDFDQNGEVEQIVTQYQNGKSFPMVLRQDLLSQLPALKRKYLHYKKL
jgi:hypothetical protein